MPLTDRTTTLTIRLALPMTAIAALMLLWLLLPARDAIGRPLPLSLALGAAFGIVLQQSRFCFWCIARDWFDQGDPRGVVGILAALAVGAVGYAAIFGAWVPNPFAGRLPPDAHVGPISVTMATGALVFGLGMAVSGSCISAHLYRLGEGAFGSLVALAGVLAGFVLGFLSWNTLYLWDIHRSVVIWLPAHLGHAGSLALTLGVLGAVALWLRRKPAPDPAPGRWPAVTGGLLVGFIATIAYLRVGPLGVTAELGSIARTGAGAADWLPVTLHGLDEFAGCATLIKETVLSRNGVFVIGLVLASLASATLAGQFRPVWPRPARLPRLFVGGLMLGWGAMVALGCTVGVLMSGVMAGALSGWVFLICCYAGGWLGWRLRLT